VRRMSPPESWIVRTLANLASGRRHSAALLVLGFHRVLAAPDPLLPNEPDAEHFAALLRLLSRHFKPIALEDAMRRLSDGSLPPRSVAVTFDDGYANNLTVAQPLLEHAGVPATVFVAPGFAHDGVMFNDLVIEAVRSARHSLDLAELGLARVELHDAASRLSAIDEVIRNLKPLQPNQRIERTMQLMNATGATRPTGLMLTEGQIRELHRRGVAIGAHTVSHPILSSVDAETAREEIAGSRRALERILDAPVRLFAYPNGRPGMDYSRLHVDQVRQAGFELAVTTSWGAATRGVDPLQIPRVGPWDTDPLPYCMRLIASYRQRSFPTL
jgi:peptidoglycan/xylan/chitin deacetylase (PgdA/CDA1 family)